MKKTSKCFLVVVLLISIVYFIIAYHPVSYSTKQEKLEITGKINNPIAAENCFELVKQVVAAANKKDLETYIDTLVKDAQKGTAKELQFVFDTYDLTHELVSFQVLKQKKESLFAVAFQRTINQGKQPYQNHVAQIHYTFVKELGQWKIQQALITDTEILK